MDVVGSDSEFTDEEKFPSLGFALSEEDEGNKNFEKKYILRCTKVMNN